MSDFMWSQKYYTLCPDCEDGLDGLHVIEVNVTKSTGVIHCAHCGKKTTLDVTLTQEGDEPMTAEIRSSKPKANKDED